MAKALITEDLHPYLEEQLREMGYDCTVRPDITNEETIAKISDYEVLIVSTKIKVNQQLLDAATQLRFVGRAGSGMENIDQDYAAKKRVVCVNSPEGNRNAVAEQAIGMLLSLFNNLRIADREVRQGIWQREENRGLEMMGRAIGIVGFGNTGETLARKLQGFDMEILAYDKYRSKFGLDFVEEVELDAIYRRADILSLHLPLTPETHHLVNRDFIHRFDKPFFLVNTSRGKVVRTSDVVNALEEGKLLGAAMDVFENEKPATFSEEEKRVFGALAARDDVILTPHIAGWTHESKRRIAEVLADRLRQHM